MIDIELLFLKVPNLAPSDLDRWILNAWVRPNGERGHYAFAEIDVARVQLIQELRHDMQVSEESLPVILGLLDQLYDTRRRMHEVVAALMLFAPEELKSNLLRHLTNSSI
jgi:chaperone modulatory protein CbpM